MKVRISAVAVYIVECVVLYMVGAGIFVCHTIRALANKNPVLASLNEKKVSFHKGSAFITPAET
jgi:hypothetical protein